MSRILSHRHLLSKLKFTTKTYLWNFIKICRINGVNYPPEHTNQRVTSSVGNIQEVFQPSVLQSFQKQPKHCQLLRH
jgi:hypothetical protein